MPALTASVSSARSRLEAAAGLPASATTVGCALDWAGHAGIRGSRARTARAALPRGGAARAAYSVTEDGHPLANAGAFCRAVPL